MSHQRYKGKMVSVLRAARAGDPGYDELVSKSDDRVRAAEEAQRTQPQSGVRPSPTSAAAVRPFPDDFVLVRTEDGSEMVVRKDEITDDPRLDG